MANVVMIVSIVEMCMIAIFVKVIETRIEEKGLVIVTIAIVVKNTGASIRVETWSLTRRNIRVPR